MVIIRQRKKKHWFECRTFFWGPRIPETGIYQCCPDIEFFQYQAGWFLQNFRIWFTCMVSIFFIFQIFLTNLVSVFWNGQHTRVSVFFLSFWNNTWPDMHNGRFCNTLNRIAKSGYADEPVFAIPYLEPPNPVMHIGQFFHDLIETRKYSI